MWGLLYIETKHGRIPGHNYSCTTFFISSEIVEPLFFKHCGVLCHFPWVFFTLVPAPKSLWFILSYAICWYFLCNLLPFYIFRKEYSLSALGSRICWFSFFFQSILSELTIWMYTNLLLHHMQCMFRYYLLLSKIFLYFLFFIFQWGVFKIVIYYINDQN